VGRIVPMKLAGKETDAAPPGDVRMSGELGAPPRAVATSTETETMVPEVPDVSDPDPGVAVLAMERVRMFVMEVSVPASVM
jgi:hypothetical protein